MTNTAHSFQEWTRDGYLVSTDPTRLDMTMIDGVLGLGRTNDKSQQQDTSTATIFGLYVSNVQIGFARVFTDRRSFARIKNLYIAEGFRRRGLELWLVQCVMRSLRRPDLKRWIIDANGVQAT